MNESSTAPKAPVPEGRGIVHGILVDLDGAPIPATPVSLFAINVRSESHLGGATTLSNGEYSIAYDRPQPLNVAVRAYDAAAQVIAQSPTIFSAPTEVQIDFTTAPDGVVRMPSTYTKLRSAVAAQLQGTPLRNLKEDKDTHELRFLASAVGGAFHDIAYLYIADVLGAKYQMRDQTFFGIFSQRIPAALDTAMRKLPDSGVDDVFTAQVLTSVLAHSRNSLAEALTAAVGANVLSASYPAGQGSELNLLDGLRVESMGRMPYGGGNTPLIDLLAAGNVSDELKAGFLRVYAANNGQLTPTWEALRATKNHPAADLATLDTTLNLGELLAGNLPLIEDTLKRLSEKTLAGIPDLALLEEADWAARIRAVDTHGNSIPQTSAADSADDRIQRFAKTISGRVASRYPTTAFRGGLSRSTGPAFQSTKKEIVSFLSDWPTFDLHTTQIDQFLVTNKATISALALADLKTAQRLFRVSRDHAAVEALMNAGHRSAQSIHFKGRDAFLAEMTPILGSVESAKMAYARAQMTYSTALTAFGRYNLSLNGINMAAMASRSPDPKTLTNLPDFKALFGSLDAFECADCQSVYSPAAYLVDLLQYLAAFPAGIPISSASYTYPIIITTQVPHGQRTGSQVSIIGVQGNTAANGSFTVTVTSATTFSLNGSKANGTWTGGGVVSVSGLPTNAKDALFLRRSEIQYIALDCNNTNTTLPYIDLVNEILEAAIAPPASPVTLIHTTGTSAERRALPQQISLAPYALTSSAVFPLSLPFDLAFAQTTTYIAALGSNRAALLSLSAGNPVPRAKAPAIACASLGINPEMQTVINGSDPHQDWERWGFSTATPSPVIDPNTRQPYNPNPADWVAALSKVPVLLDRTGLSLQQLYQLLEVVWVTQSGVTLQLGTTTTAGVQTLSPDTDLMVFHGLTADVLDRANRYLRLSTASGLQMWELDWALEWRETHGGILNDDFLVFLAGAIAVATQLKLPFQEALSFWLPMGTRDVVNHLSEQDVVAPSTYSNVFRNAAVLASWNNIFVPLTRSLITGASQATPIAITTEVPHGYQTGMRVSITGVLGNTAANNIFTITVTGPNSFTLNGSAGNAPWTSGGVAVGILSGDPILGIDSVTPTPEQNALMAALALSANDIEAILGAPNALTLDSLNVLLRYRRLASSLSLSIPDLILWIQLTGGKPFDGDYGPADTLEFCRRLGVLLGTGLTAADLDYLLRHQSASKSSLTFTNTQAKVLLQAVRDAIVKVPSLAGLPVTSASNASPIAITTATTHGLTTGTQVCISGVLGNTAANGQFTVTVTGTTSFTLDTSVGNGAWSSGGMISILVDSVSNTSPIAISTPEPHGLQTGAQVSINGALGNTAANGTFIITVTNANSFTLNGSSGNGVWTNGAILAATKVVAGASNKSPIEITTASPHGLGTGAQVSINGVIGNSAANDTFTITVTSPTSFTLNGSAGNGDWVSGGAIIDTIPVVGASDTSPISVTTASPHRLRTGAQVSISSVLGNTAANGTFAITATSPTSFTLDNSVGNGVWVSGGTVIATINVVGASNASPISITTASPHGLGTGAQVLISGVVGNTATNGIFTITVTSPTSFTLDGTAGNGAWANGTTISIPTPDPATIQTVFVNALAAATGVTANVVTPVLRKLAILAGVGQQIVGAKQFLLLAPSQSSLLFGQSNGVDPTKFPELISAFTSVGKAAALFRALQPTENEFAFVIKNASTFQWLDPSQLPLSPVTASPYAQFECLLRAFKLDQRQTARLPKLFDVLGGWLPPNSPPVDLPAAIGGTVIAPSIAAALNASIGDVTAIANGLGARTPDLAHPPGSLADISMLAAIADALDVLMRYGISGVTLVQLAAAPATADSASAAMGVLQAQYSQSARFAAIQPVEDALRQTRRDALVAYLLGQGAATPTPLLLTTDDLYDYYLVDPEMSACALTTRLLQASLAIQQFMQQCFLNVFFSNVAVEMSNTRASEWSWRQQYRLWQANREVFLYPENYLLPELRTNASPFFTELENDLRQSSGDSNAADAALENYLRKLVNVAKLRIAAHCSETLADRSSTVLHVFASTDCTPPHWYYRTRTTQTPGTGSWTAWQSLDLDIASQHLLPVIWERRLHLIWPVFKLISEKQSDQSVPQSGGGGTSRPPQNFWAVEFATSELSAGQWQPKQTFSNRMYFKKNTTTVTSNPPITNTTEIDRPPIVFTFMTGQLAPELSLYVYSNLEFGGAAVAAGTLPVPGGPLAVVQTRNLFPDPSLVDLSQEPSYGMVSITDNFSFALNRPSNYIYQGQDLVYGGPTGQIFGTCPLTVLNWMMSQNIELLGTITNPRMVVQSYANVGDIAGLLSFFVDDAQRSYLVQPQWGSGFNVSEWAFQTFYHPYARTFLRELEIGGVSQMMARSLQLDPQSVRGWTPAFDFKALYNPQPPVPTPYPGAPGAPDPGETALDFSAGSSGAYSLYNWEIFYHVPMFIASFVLQNAMRSSSGADQQFQAALSWLKYIFDPTDSSGGPTPQRYWQMAPFNAMNAPDWINQEIQKMLSTLASGTNDPATTQAIDDWMSHPFDPHAVAGLRISAYAKATVMKLFDVLIAWGDWYYSQYTAETVNQAEQLYILVDMMLGPQPETVRPPNTGEAADTATYASVNLDKYSNALVSVENLVVAPEPPTAIIEGTVALPSLPHLPGHNNKLLFCIPPNPQLLAYWTTVAQRLYKIRHCLNLQGVAQPLPLYAPPINPLALVENQAAGAAVQSAPTQPAPIYRFSVYLQKAIELTNDVRAYGALILSALEKQDAEALAVLRANQELDIQTRILDVKTQQVTEAQDQITAIQNQKAVVQIRYNFYSKISFMNAWETQAITLQGEALIANGAAVALDMTSGVAHMLPSFQFGAAGFGGSPTATASFGGENIGAATSSWAAVARGLGGILSERGGIAATLGGYQRRMDDWNFQAQLASAELAQIDGQIVAATDRLNIANKELSIQSAQISNAQAVSDFLTKKYTNRQLYDWMISQLTTVYTQAYQLAFSLALQAQNAYQYELGGQDAFMKFGYWDSQHKGLTAGESLLFDLRRMQAQYIAENSREQELTKHISLVLTDPLALVMLRETGACQLAFDETLFDYDHPGQYFRRLRSVALTVPCVTGPYTGVNATLSLTSAMVRTQSPGTSYQPQDATAPPNDPSVVVSPVAAAGTTTISTSSGQNDPGVFDLNLRDDRWLPFEGQGAISTWNLLLDPRDNNFDFTTITDVVLHVRYTARGGGDQTATNNVRAALKPQTPRSILISTRNTFGSAFYTFFNPPDPSLAQQTLTIPLTPNVFPFSNLGTGGAKISDISIWVILTVPANNSVRASYTLDAVKGKLNLSPSKTQTTSQNPVNAITGDISITPPAAAPQILAVTVPAAEVPPNLGTTLNGQTVLDPTKIEDILLILTYSLA